MTFDPTIPLRTLFGIPILGDLWWLWIFIVLFFLTRSLWLAYIQEFYKHSIAWTIIEIKIPRELRKSPKAMEQVFMTMHAIRNNASNLKEIWWDGEVTLWSSCEIISRGGEIHYYMRIPTKHRNIIEASLYAHYTDIEISEVREDYTTQFPSTYLELEKLGYNIFGSEFMLAKPDAYPIRSYVDFEEIEEERQLDPISALLETLAKIKLQETVWIQILIQPTDDSWKEESKKLINEFKESTGRSQFESIEGGKSIMKWSERSPGETDILKALDRNIAKPGFETMVRYIYIAPKNLYDANFGQRGVFSAFNQYASEALNKFRHNTKVWTRASFWWWPHFFPERRRLARRIKIYQKFIKRQIRETNFFSRVLDMQLFQWNFRGREAKIVLNAEELATIYHPPTAVVLTGPIIKRVEAKKAGPPAGLAIYGEGEGEDLPGIKDIGK